MLRYPKMVTPLEGPWCVKVVHIHPLRAAQDVWQLVYVFNSVLEGLYFGQRLSFLAIVRREVVTELVQSFCKTPHPHLLPLARLHASLRRHLGLARPLLLRRCRRRVRLEVEGQVADLLMSICAAHLRRGAHRVPGGLRWCGMKRVPPPVFQGSPIGQYLGC